MQPFYPGCFAPEMPKKCLPLAILWCLGILNDRGVKEVTWFQTVSTVVKMTVLCFVSLTGIVLLVRGRKENLGRFEKAFDAEVSDASQIAEAFLQGLYAYYGWGVLVRIAGKVIFLNYKKHHHTINIQQLISLILRKEYYIVLI